MSSDILIGYTGHGVVRPFGLLRARHVRRRGGAAHRSSRPASGWRSSTGWSPPPRSAAFVAYFSTRLRDIYFAITTLIFSQIFYVIIFTWTEVTGGENGLTFSRPPLAIPGLFSVPFTPDDAALVRARGGGAVLSAAAPHHPVAVRHGAAVDPRERGAHPRHRLSDRALQDRRGDAFRPVRRAGRRALRASRTGSPRPISSSSWSRARSSSSTSSAASARWSGRSSAPPSFCCCARGCRASSPNTT